MAIAGLADRLIVTGARSGNLAERLAEPCAPMLQESVPPPLDPGYVESLNEIAICGRNPGVVPAADAQRLLCDGLFAERVYARLAAGNGPTDREYEPATTDDRRSSAPQAPR